MVYSEKDGKLVRAPETILGGDPSKHRPGGVFSAPVEQDSHRKGVIKSPERFQIQLRQREKPLLRATA